MLKTQFNKAQTMCVHPKRAREKREKRENRRRMDCSPTPHFSPEFKPIYRR
jgi:hypothetical protein